MSSSERQNERQAEDIRIAELVVRDAQMAIRILLLINGGAAVSLLAFAGGLVGRTYDQGKQ